MNNKDVKFRPRATYFPFDNGLYTVSPGLRPMGTTFLNPIQVEESYFQIDDNFDHYRKSKLYSFSHGKERYVGEFDLSASQRQRAIGFILERLLTEYPDFFKLYRQSHSEKWTLHCIHSGDIIEAKNCFKLSKVIHGRTDPLEALALQVQEDFSLWTEVDSKDWMSYVSVLFPNHWDPSEKIGKNFFAVHKPVGASKKMLDNSAQLVQLMINKGPYVRFAWGLATDTRLDHHPVAPQSKNIKEWSGRSFDPKRPELWVRVERQCLHGFPDEFLSFFTIRTYFENVCEIAKNQNLAKQLLLAIRSIQGESLKYKGLNQQSQKAICEWIEKISNF